MNYTLRTCVIIKETCVCVISLITSTLKLNKHFDLMVYIYDLDCRLVVESTFRFLMTHQSIMAVEPTKPERQFMYGWHLQRRNVCSHRKLAHYSISSFFLWKPFGCPSQSAHTGNTIETSRCATKWRSDTRYNSSDYKFQYYFPLKKKNKNLNAR